MHAIPYIFSSLTDDILKATHELQGMTHERWTVDWEQLELVCSHGIRVNHWFALSSPADFVRRRIVARHESADPGITYP